VFRGAGDGEAILQADGTEGKSRVVSIAGTDHLMFEDLTLQNAHTAIYSGKPGSVGITIRRCRIKESICVHLGDLWANCAGPWPSCLRVCDVCAGGSAPLRFFSVFLSVRSVPLWFSSDPDVLRSARSAPGSSCRGGSDRPPGSMPASSPRRGCSRPAPCRAPPPTGQSC
jgi:hypothetical protein